MMKKIILSLLFIALSVTVMAQSKPQSAEKALDEAYKNARNKNVMIVFHASWCKWCKKLETALNSADLKKVFEENYSIAYLDVMERGGKIDSLENPGGKEIMKKYGGEKAGLPFIVFVDKKGKLLANSNVMNGNANIGYPGSKEEVDAFCKLLKKTSKKITSKQLKEVRDYLIKNAPHANN